MATCTACGAPIGGAGAGCVTVAVAAVVGTGSVCAGRSKRGVVQRGEVNGVTSTASSSGRPDTFAYELLTKEERNHEMKHLHI